MTILNRPNINEGASDILYHFTHSLHLINILQTNRFNLAVVVGTRADAKINNNKFYFLSTTRSKRTGFVSGDIKLELNGRLLKHNNKFVPVDYWQYSKNPKDYTDAYHYISALTSTEQEDRIVSNKSYIPNAIKYINSVHYNIDSKHLNRSRLQSIHKIVKLTNDLNVPLYMYDDKKNWLQQTNSLGESEINKILQYYVDDDNDEGNSTRDKFYYETMFIDKLAAYVAFNDNVLYEKIMTYFNKLIQDNQQNSRMVELTNKIITNIDKNIKDLKYDLHYLNEYNINEKTQVLSNAIHNTKGNTSQYYKWIIDLLTWDMRRNKIIDIKKYIEYKVMIGKKSLSTYANELLKYLYNLLDNELDENFKMNFRSWIEIDEEYYTTAYECKQLQQLINEFKNEYKKVIKNLLIENQNEIYKNKFVIHPDDIKEKIKFKKYSIYDNINITDLSNNYSDLDESMTEILNWTIRSVYEGYISKTKEQFEEYQNQFR